MRFQLAAAALALLQDVEAGPLRVYRQRPVRARDGPLSVLAAPSYLSVVPIHLTGGITTTTSDGSTPTSSSTRSKDTTTRFTSIEPTPVKSDPSVSTPTVVHSLDPEPISLKPAPSSTGSTQPTTSTTESSSSLARASDVPSSTLTSTTETVSTKPSSSADQASSPATTSSSGHGIATSTSSSPSTSAATSDSPRGQSSSIPAQQSTSESAAPSSSLSGFPFTTLQPQTSTVPEASSPPVFATTPSKPNPVIPTIIAPKPPQSTASVAPDAFAANLRQAQIYNKAFESLTSNSPCTANQAACVGTKQAVCNSSGGFDLIGCPSGQACFALPMTTYNGIMVGCHDVADAEKILGGEQKPTSPSTPTSLVLTPVPKVSTSAAQPPASTVIPSSEPTTSVTKTRSMTTTLVVTPPAATSAPPAPTVPSSTSLILTAITVTPPAAPPATSAKPTFNPGVSIFDPNGPPPEINRTSLQVLIPGKKSSLVVAPAAVPTQASVAAMDNGDARVTQTVSVTTTIIQKETVTATKTEKETIRETVTLLVPSGTQ